MTDRTPARQAYLDLQRLQGEHGELLAEIILECQRHITLGATR